MAVPPIIGEVVADRPDGGAMLEGDEAGGSLAAGGSAGGVGLEVPMAVARLGAPMTATPSNKVAVSTPICFRVFI
jgi:hypothetical protein